MIQHEVVLVVTGDTPPLPGLSPNGAGIRAWGMAEALRLLGHDAALLFPTECLAGRPHPEIPRVAAMPRAEIALAPPRWEGGRPLVDFAGNYLRPKAIVYQHWGIMSEGAPCGLPLAVDLAGPHLLERFYWGTHDLPDSLRDKLNALARADFAVIGGRWQAAWMAPFLAAAWGDEKGVLDQLELLAYDEAAPRIGLADFFLPTEIARVSPQPYRDAERPVIAYAGAFLPWQNPAWAIRETLAFLDEIGRGELLLIGSPLPGVPMEGEFAELLATLDLHPRVRRLGRAPLDWVASHVAGADAVLDLMAPNPERILASPARAFLYKSLGVPTIRNDYDEQREAFAGGLAGNGWAIHREDRHALRAALEEIAAGSAGASRRAADRAARPFDPLPSAQAAAGALAAWLKAGAKKVAPASPRRFATDYDLSRMENPVVSNALCEIEEAQRRGDAAAVAKWTKVLEAESYSQVNVMPTPAPAIAAAAAERFDLPGHARDAITDGLSKFHGEALGLFLPNRPGGGGAAPVPPTNRVFRHALTWLLAPLAGLMAFVATLWLGGRWRQL